jgi:thiamine-monophosphate kinase
VERDFVAWLTRRQSPDPRLAAGLGDDAAVFSPFASGARLVAAVDAITDRVDFHIDATTPEAVGHKALGVNLSDLAAMAAAPLAYLAALVLPRDGGAGHDAAGLARGIHEGMARLAQRHGAVLAGGDTNTWDGPLAVSVTVLGLVGARGPLRRCGALPGDVLLVTGPLGGSLSGRHLAVAPRVSEMQELHGRHALHAAIDLSDGLALDASRLAEASGCGVELDLAAIPVHDDARAMAQKSGRSPLQHALGDGEDFEILIAAPADQVAAILSAPPSGLRIAAIGRCVPEAGLWQRDAQGNRSPLPATGYEHQGRTP